MSCHRPTWSLPRGKTWSNSAPACCAKLALLRDNDFHGEGDLTAPPPPDIPNLPRTIKASVFFLFFAALAPAIAFGAVLTSATQGMLGATEVILATAVGGVAYAAPLRSAHVHPRVHRLRRDLHRDPLPDLHGSGSSLLRHLRVDRHLDLDHPHVRRRDLLLQPRGASSRSSRTRPSPRSSRASSASSPRRRSS